MSTAQEIDGPYPFSQADLTPDRLMPGVRHTLAHFRQWCEKNPRAVGEHIDRYTHQLGSLTAGGRLPRVIGTRLLPGLRRRAERARTVRDIYYFGLYNLGEIPEPERVHRIVDGGHGRIPSVSGILAAADPGRGVAGVVDALERHIPVLRTLPETTWLAERLDGLYRALPEVVVRAGGMGKLIRATVGVLAIGAYDTLGAEPEVRQEHLARIIPGACALGAAYVIVDDTLHDLPGDHISAADRDRYHQMIAQGLSTGAPIAASDVPDHPLAEQLHELYGLVLKSHPFDEFRHLYHAAEAMYHAQHRDAGRSVTDPPAGGIETLYEDIFVKAGMSRVVANILGRRAPDGQMYTRCLNTIFLGQFKDDLRDRVDDSRAGRLTPFTFPFAPGGVSTPGVNPLYDLFAYDAYVVSQVYRGDPVAADTLAHVGAVKLVSCLPGGRHDAEELIRAYGATGEIAGFLRAAAGLPPAVAARLEPAETLLKDGFADSLRHRDPTTVDARTFVADRLPYINGIAVSCYPGAAPVATPPIPPPGPVSASGAGGHAELEDIAAYAMSAPGKRLRPALGLMLAAELGVETTSIEPLVAASELFHTASLMFDDLPAQDDAQVRRGRPTAHTVYDEGSVQLAAISMISSGFGMIAQLGPPYRAEKVAEVIAYLGTVLGPARLCRGQELDLRMGRAGRQAEITGDAIIEMYELKTSTAIEAALVPLMMLVDRPPDEIELIRGYARHAGIVFQIRDDILDLTSSTESLGKDADNDVGKVNVVRAYGLGEAQRLLQAHLDEALGCCARLPFDTRLLQGMAHHFANRRK